jgi:hypothetical protein
MPMAVSNRRGGEDPRGSARQQRSRRVVRHRSHVRERHRGIDLSHRRSYRADDGFRIDCGLDREDQAAPHLLLRRKIVGAAAAKENDVLLITNAGAYGYAMSSRYNLREPAKEVLI